MSALRTHVPAVLLLVGIGLLAAGTTVWRCLRDPEIPFLTSGPGEWVLYPLPYILEAREVKKRTVCFSREFDLSDSKTPAEVEVRAFRSYELRINGRSIAVGPSSGRSWKTADRYPVTEALLVGTNRLEVDVANHRGPPALSLRLRVGSQTVRTDATWQARTEGVSWSPVRLAKEPMTHAITATSPTVREAWSKVWPMVLIGVGAAVLIVLTAWFGFRRFAACGSGDVQRAIRPAEWGLFALVVVSWIVLCANNLTYLQPVLGFDAPAHYDYLRFLEVNRRLPLAGDGWEMYQPPLYYVATVVVTAVCRSAGLTAAEALVPRLMSMAGGLAAVVLMWFVLRTLFPDSVRARCAGLILTGSMPMLLYMSNYPSNEVMCVAFTIAAILVALRILGTDDPAWRLWVMLGFLLGLAMVSKHTAFLAVVFILASLAVHHVHRYGLNLRRLSGTVGVSFSVMFLVGGWFLIRNWVHFKNPLVGNWDPVSGIAWWQDPGYGVLDYYLRFGRSLTAPFHSSLYSYADGIYSTVWGDGMCAGIANVQFRAPWHYDLMCVGYVMAMFPTVLIGVGLLVTLSEWLRRPTTSWAMVVGHGLFVVFAVFYMTLRLPYYAQAKGFYGLSSMTCLCALGAVGFDRLARALGRGSPLIWILLLAHAVNAYASFFVGPMDARELVSRGEVFAYQGMPERALGFFRKAIAKDAGLGVAHARLATVLVALGRHAEAKETLSQGLRRSPKNPELMNNLAWLMATCTDAAVRDGRESRRLAEEALRTAPAEDVSVLDTLAAAQAECGDFAAAVQTASRAITLAESAGRQDLLSALRARMALYEAHRPFRQ